MDLDELTDALNAPDLALNIRAKTFLSDPQGRIDVYRKLHPNPSARFACILRASLTAEVEYRQTNPDGEYFEGIYWCAFLLSQVAQPPDVLLLWRAKHATFDTRCGFDDQALLSQGREPIVNFLKTQANPESEAILDFIGRFQGNAGSKEHNDWLRWRTEYFTEA